MPLHTHIVLALGQHALARSAQRSLHGGSLVNGESEDMAGAVYDGPLPSPRRRRALSRRTCGDVMLCGVTLAELSLLVFATPTFTALDWIYVLQHVIVLGVALTRPPPSAQDLSWLATTACIVAYAYPYAQIIYLRIVPGFSACPQPGHVLVTVAAGVSLASLLTLGRRFGIRPALRGLAQTGPYGQVRHPLYLAYLLADVGINCVEWNGGTVLLTAAGWVSLLYRIRAEERILAQDPGWAAYVRTVRFRLLPGLW
jgi:protein-S-isoprenylcysteine O-methyltransferase Ste14